MKLIENILKKYGIEASFYADDVQLRIKFKPECVENVIDLVEKCIREITVWMSSCFLKLNPEKTMIKLFKPKKNIITKFFFKRRFRYANNAIRISKSFRSGTRRKNEF